MATEDVVLAVGGQSIRAVSISISIGADMASRSFEATLAGDKAQMKAWAALFGPSPAAKVLASGTVVLTGHVEKYSLRFAAESYEMTVSGRSKTGDAVDSSHNHKKGEFKNKSPKAIITEIAKDQGVEIEGAGGAAARELFRLNPGETIFRAAERLARRDGFSITDTPDGKLHLFDQPTEDHAGALIEGRDFEEGSAVFDQSKRFKKTEVKGQAPVDHDDDNLRFTAEVEDETGARNRRKVIVAPEFLRKLDAKKRAQHHRDRSAGRGLTCEFTVPRWRDEAGEIWAPRKKIYVESDLLDLAKVMMLERVTLKQSGRDGTRAEMSFVDPRAYGGKKGKADKSGKQHSMKGAGADKPATEPVTTPAPAGYSGSAPAPLE